MCVCVCVYMNGGDAGRWAEVVRPKRKAQAPGGGGGWEYRTWKKAARQAEGRQLMTNVLRLAVTKP